MGADAFVARESGDVRADVERLVGARSADVVADVVGGGVFDDLLKLLRRGGRYTTAGAIAGPATQIDLRDLVYKDLELFGITSPTPATFARVVALVEAGRLEPLLERTFPLPDLRSAQAAFLERTHFGKLVVTVRE